MIKPSRIKPMQDWQRLLLEENISLYYAAMKQYGAARHIDNELGNAVMFRLCANMYKYDPNIGTISTFIFMQVRYALCHAKRDYAGECMKQKRITDAMQLNLEREYCLTNNGHNRAGDLEDAISKLPLRLKTLVGLHYNKQLSLRECGVAMGRSKQRVEQLLGMAKALIVKLMSTMKGARL